MQRLRARAAADGRPIADLVRRWLEAGISGALEQQSTTAAPAAGPDVLARLAAMEAAVADLRYPASPERVGRPAQPGEHLPLPERRLALAEPSELLTIPKVGKALRLSSDSALTNWIARKASKRDGSAVDGI